MQDYIKNHINEEIKFEDIVKLSVYSKGHATRIFKELLGRTPLVYVNIIQFVPFIT